MSKGVIFDFDGVLLNSGFDNFRWADEARERKARELGYEHDLEVLRAIFNHPGDRESFEEVLEDHDIDREDMKTWEEAVTRRKIEMMRNREIDLFEGAKPLLESLGKPVSIVSNASYTETKHAIEEFEIGKFLESWRAPRLDDIVEYVGRMKPRTHMLEEVMEEMGVEDGAMIGDNPSDIVAGNRLELETVFLDRQSGVFPDADYSVESLEQVGDIINGL